MVGKSPVSGWFSCFSQLAVSPASKRVWGAVQDSQRTYTRLDIKGNALAPCSLRLIEIGAWKVSWHAASAFTPAAYASLLPETTAIVHTIGVLFEDNGYKTALRQGNLPELLKISARSATNSSNPLKAGGQGSYESMNYESGEAIIRRMRPPLTY